MIRHTACNIILWPSPTIWYGMALMRYDMIWYHIWYDMVYDMIYDIRYTVNDMIYDMIWYIWYMIYDMIWYDMIWYDMIWYVMWCDVIWYDIYDATRYDMMWYWPNKYLFYPLFWMFHELLLTDNLNQHLIYDKKIDHNCSNIYDVTPRPSPNIN